MSTRLVWKGAQVEGKVREATADGIDAVTKAAAEDAAGSHWWASRTGNLEAEIISEPAERRGRRKVSGKFGSTKGPGFYGLFLELRTPFLRPAADRNFRNLAREIRRRIS